ncbi:GNAT family N-acetyltransferase [Plantactinospora sp. S1510]|uniref:GNAT family N-acetyltransferase n=1 Tax=Plantactinospora alkalitolerans TaxID=2789879 RepID=A0ABS0H4V7_9ACTN|nr:GNAT family N-acetyltransferase [Plantactinospora alkalitolerans]MBF9133164.1 GNAT family N-acetyltransferase [Plantactinospora alkalitolerans]
MREVGTVSPLDVSIAPPEQADDGEFVAEVVDLVNRVYAGAEKGLWRDGTDRTSPAEVTSLIRAGQLAVARMGGRLVGTVRLQRLGGGEGAFGMLVASPDDRGIGIGRELVAFAERWARERQLDRMQLELLVPQTWTHPVKEFLRDWYTRIGYREIRRARLDEAYPALQPHLATPCDFVIYHKSL